MDSKQLSDLLQKRFQMRSDRLNDFDTARKNNGSQQDDYFIMDSKQLSDLLRKRFRLHSDQLNDIEPVRRNYNSQQEDYFEMDSKQLSDLLQKRFRLRSDHLNHDESRNLVNSTLCKSKTSFRNAERQRKKDDKKRQTDQLFSEALRSGISDDEVAALFLLLGGRNDKMKPVEEKDDSTASTSPSIEEDILETLSRAREITPYILKERRTKEEATTDSGDTSVDNTITTKSGSGFRDVLRNMGKGRSRKDDDTISLFDSDDGRSKFGLRKIKKDSRLSHDSFEERRSTEKIVIRAMKEGKTPKEIGEMLMKLEEQRLQKLRKRRARQLVEKAVEAGKGKSPKDIASFLLEREEEKSLEELIAKALKESRTTSELAEYLISLSGEKETSPNISMPKMRTPLVKEGSQQLPSSVLPTESKKRINKNKRWQPSPAGSVDNDYYSASASDIEYQRSCYSYSFGMARENNEDENICLGVDMNDLEEQIMWKLHGAKICAGEVREYANEVVEIANEFTNEVKGGLQRLEQHVSR